jgi:hypothetical protein
MSSKPEACAVLNPSLRKHLANEQASTTGRVVANAVTIERAYAGEELTAAGTPALVAA